MPRYYNYYESQLEAIEDLYEKLAGNNERIPSMEEVIVSWLTDGYAEKFREDYFQDQVATIQ